MKESQSDIKVNPVRNEPQAEIHAVDPVNNTISNGINIKRLTLLLGLAIVALLLSILPKDKKVAEEKKYMGGDGAGDTALIPTARADDIGIISPTGGGSTG